MLHLGDRDRDGDGWEGKELQQFNGKTVWWFPYENKRGGGCFLVDVYIELKSCWES